ncbi:MAG: cellobiose phosphorylase [bacterium]|nr:cellobiose phosphorylase [bacterium]
MRTITPDGSFVVEDYNWKPAFSNFLPGIAGKTGIPMWAYYVSRAQCLCSAGVRDKDNQILEFLSFNRALQVVGQQGFRTFIRIGRGRIHEPFRKRRRGTVVQRMIVGPGELTLVESDPRLGLETTATYFTLPGEEYPALLRTVTIRNISSRRLEGEIVDGAARILPFGCDCAILHTTARHIEGMMGVFPRAGVPVFRLKQSPADVERVEQIRRGTYYASLTSGNPDPRRAVYVVDPAAIFGDAEIYDRPWGLEAIGPGAIGRLPQVRQNRTPCAFTAAPFRLPSGRSFRVHSLIGQAEEAAVPRLLRRLSARSFERKRAENAAVLRSIGKRCLTASAEPAFDHYCEQTFLDNVIRGGMPVVWNTAEGKSAFYIYSRQNGDLERDYHFFILEPTFYSQGTGHYRSVNQNRRLDAWFFPQTGDENIRLFMSLIQTDGYNPLEINQVTYRVVRKTACRRWLRLHARGKGIEELQRLLSRPFAPGEFVMKARKARVRGADDADRLLSRLLRFCAESDFAGIHEGYWVDHWLYNLDLIDSFLSVYPERAEELLVGNRRYYFYDNPDLVVPRAEKYVLTGGGVRRYGAVRRDAGKERRVAARAADQRRVRIDGGAGKIYSTCLLVKLLCCAANRLATLDPAGIGVEMEADKPGWNDSMNGLPGLIGSSLCQTFELERVLRFLLSRLDVIRRPVRVCSELAAFMDGLADLCERRAAGKIGAFRYWDRSNALKERYRARTAAGLEGGETPLDRDRIGRFLESGLRVVLRIYRPENRRAVFDPAGIPYTYLVNRVTRFRRRRGRDGRPLRNADGLPLVEPLAFRQEPLPLFLEGPVHFLRVHPERAGEIYRAVRNSGLFDRRLKMYKVCAPLSGAPFEIGRVLAWGPGWIENESVYTHMEFKFLLELLRSGLHESFFSDIRSMLPPFLSPRVYGRSILENVSFIVSSAFPDEKMHGRGLQPRLSGVTGEMLHIWTLMTAGPDPFFMEDGLLRFRLRPALPAWLFSRRPREATDAGAGGAPRRFVLPRNAFAFRLLGGARVVYRNAGRRDTYGPGGARVSRYRLRFRDGRRREIDAPVLDGRLARAIREGRVAEIEAELA